MPCFTKDRRERPAPWDECNSRRWRGKFLISDAVKDAKVGVRWMRAEGKQ